MVLLFKMNKEKSTIDYTPWRETLRVKLTKLEEDLEKTYCEEEKFCRLPDAELDWKWDAWKQLQDIMNETMTPEIFSTKADWPQWATNMWTVLMVPQEGRTCRRVILGMLQYLSDD